MKTLKIPLRWAIFTAIVSFSCGDAVDPLKDDAIITDIAFYKVGYNAFPEFGENWLTQLRVDKYKVSDTMAIWFETRTTGFYPPPVARVISHKTGDSQDINFVIDPTLNWWFIELNSTRFEYIGYISPVKHISYADKLIPDPSKKQLKIDIKGDTLTAYIKNKDQILTITIPVKGD